MGGAPTCATTVFIAPPLSLNAQVLAWRSARIAFGSSALTLSVPTSRLSKPPQGPEWAAFEQHAACAGMAEMCVSHLNGWLASSGSHQSPKMGGPITHPLLTKRPGLADDQPIPRDSAHPPGGYAGGPASLIGSAAPIPPGICDFWPWVTLAAAGASLPTAALAG